jgi:hypothetical protein
MPDHDPMCPDGRADHNKPPVSQCGWCDFATRVREDGYKAGYSAAIEALGGKQ